MNFLYKNIRFLGAILTVFVLLTGCINTSKPEHSNKINLTQKQRIDSLFNTAVDNGEIPGAVVHISLNGIDFFEKAYGYSSLESKSKMKENAIFRLASMTKGLTAIAILQLYEKGLLDLNDFIYEYIPEFKNPEILIKVNKDSTFVSTPATKNITIHQLLTHTSGIGYGFQDEKYNALVIKNNISEGFCEDRRNSLENTLKIARLPLLCEPGERNIYSLSYDVLGTLIEVITQQRYDDYIVKNILIPLEMKNSYFLVPDVERHRLVSVYQPDSLGKMIPTKYAEINFPIADEKQFFSGGADLCSTASDYTKFVQMIARGGKANGKRILGSKYIEMMLSKQTGFDDGNSDQGFAAWMVNEKGAKEDPMSVGSYGFGGFFDTYSWTDPQKHFVATLLLQMYPTNEHSIHEKYQKTVYKIINEIKEQ